MNILIVEDDDGMCILLKRLLQKVKAEVWRVETWTEMVQVLETQDIQVVLLDLGLPDSYTTDSLSRVKLLKMQHPQTAVCIVTGNASVTRESAMAAGADDFIHKDSLTQPLRLVNIVTSLFARFGERSNKLNVSTHLYGEAAKEVIKKMQD